MQTKTGIKTFSEIEETPIDRYSKFNKYMILNDKVGSNFTDVDKHFSKLYSLINHPAKLKKQIDLFRQLVFSITEEQSFELMAYACLIESINGEARNDLTVNGLEETIRRIQGMKAEEVKKKFGLFQKMQKKILQIWIRIFSTNPK